MKRSTVVLMYGAVAAALLALMINSPKGQDNSLTPEQRLEIAIYCDENPKALRCQ